MKHLILCVDDDRTVLEGLRIQIRKITNGDFQLEAAESGEEALEVLDDLAPGQDQFPLIICDQIMPGIKGDELFVQIHQRYPQTTKILLTGQADAASVGNALNKGGLYRYLGKPWERDDLEITLQEGLNRFFKHWELQKAHEALKLNMETFFRFVPRQFLSYLGIPESDYRQLQTGMATKGRFAVLFLDIRSFSTLCQTIPEEEVFVLLNDFFRRIGKPMVERGGFVDKFIGDAIMTLYPDNQSALQSALEVLDELDKINAERQKAGKIHIKVGIGVDGGELIMGTLGADDRYQTTVLGNCVNTASRLEELTKTYNRPLIISDEIYQSIQKQDLFESLGDVQPRGQRSAITIYGIKGRTL